MLLHALLCLNTLLIIFLTTTEFRKTHLYNKFLTSLKSALGMKPGRDADPNADDKTTDTPGVFSEEIQRQMEGRGMKDDFLKMHFENLMNTRTEEHSILEESFTEYDRIVCQ